MGDDKVQIAPRIPNEIHKQWKKIFFRYGELQQSIVHMMLMYLDDPFMMRSLKQRVRVYENEEDYFNEDPTDEIGKFLERED